MPKRIGWAALWFCLLPFSISLQAQNKHAIAWGGTVELQNGKTTGNFASGSGKLRYAMTLKDALSYLTDGVPLLKQEVTNSVVAIEFLPFSPEEITESKKALEAGQPPGQHLKYFSCDIFFPRQVDEREQVCDLRKAVVTIVRNLDQHGYPVQGSPASTLTVFMFPNEITLGDEYSNGVFPLRATQYKAIRSR